MGGYSYKSGILNINRSDCLHDHFCNCEGDKHDALVTVADGYQQYDACLNSHFAYQP